MAAGMRAAAASIAASRAAAVGREVRERFERAQALIDAGTREFESALAFARAQRVPLTPREMGEVRVQRAMAREQIRYQRERELVGPVGAAPTVQDVSHLYGPEAAVDYALEMGIYPDEWAQDVADEWGDDYDIDVHDLYEEFHGATGPAETAA
jgi:hypothetical protein